MKVFIFINLLIEMSHKWCSPQFFCFGCCHLQIYALKALVRSFLPHRGTHVKRQINDLLDIMSEMLPKGDISYDTGSWYASKVIYDIMSC